MPRPQAFILTLACRDATGIVSAVSGLLCQAGCNITDSRQFGDVQGDIATGLIFIRVQFQAPLHMATTAMLENLFSHLRTPSGMDARFHAVAERPRLLLMVSQHGDCLDDLLLRWQSGQLEVEIAAIVSRHVAFAGLADSCGIAFRHLPLPAGSDVATQRAQERQVEAIQP